MQVSLFAAVCVASRAPASNLSAHGPKPKTHEPNQPANQPANQLANQPASQPPEPPVPAPDVVWKQIASTYRTGTIAERIRVGVLRPRPASKPDPLSPPEPDRLALEELLRSGGPDADEQRGVVFLRMAPQRPQQPGESSPIIRLEMGDLRVFGEAGRLIATRSSVPGGVVLKNFEGPITVPQLHRLMPPLALPQLSLALDPDPDHVQLCPGVSPPQWRTVQRVREAGKPRFVLRGVATSARGEHQVQVTVEEATSRLTHVRVGPAESSPDTARGSGEAVLELFITQIDPGDPASWRIDTSGRIAVASLDELRSAPPAAPVVQSTLLKDGDPLPQLYLYNAQAESWSSEKSPAGRFGGIVQEDASAFRIALLVFLPPAPGDQPAKELLARACSAMEQALADASRASTPSPDSRGPALACAGVAMIELERFDEVRRTALRDWTSMQIGTPRGAMPLLCSPAGKSMQSRFAEHNEPVILIVDQSLTVRKLIAIHDPPGPTEDPKPPSLAQRIRSALLEGP